MSATANSSHEVTVTVFMGNVNVEKGRGKVMFEAASQSSIQAAINKLDYVATRLAAEVAKLREQHGSDQI